MKTAGLVLLFSLPLLAQSPVVPEPRVLQPGDLECRQKAATTLRAALDGGEDVLAAVRLAAETLPPHSTARTRADTMLAAALDPKALRREVADLVADLTFRPVAEADLPQGVPGFQALDELEVRSYPAYRMVRTGMRGGSIGAFWPLFQHISSREIAMTTPVQIDYSADERRAESMAFLYGSADVGTTGKDGRVEVVDMPAMTVVTVGSRGYDRPARVEEMRERLLSWLAASTEWEVAGPMRTMGYNSPSVGDDRRYFEVQIPLRKRSSTDGKRESV